MHTHDATQHDLHEHNIGTAWYQVAGYTERLREDPNLNEQDDPVLYRLVRFIDELAQYIDANDPQCCRRPRT